MDKEMKVEKGMVVSYAYRLYNTANNELLFEATVDSPDTMIYGVTEGIVPGLVAAMDSLKIGDRFEVELPAMAAFGQRSDENILELDATLFERDGKMAPEVVAGAILPMMTAEGFRVQGRVLEVGKTVKMDFNHPFAGMDVRYEGEIVDMRPATEDELNPKGCGGCCGGGCGSDCGSDCGSECGGCGK